MVEDIDIHARLAERFGADAVVRQPTADGVPTLWVGKEKLREVLRHLKTASRPAFDMLFDLTAIDERMRANRPGQPPSDFTVVYHLLSMEGNLDVRLKVALPAPRGEPGDQPTVPSVTGLWASANWYERELWDMFGIRVEGHPGLSRILMPPWWEGHPLRKEHYSRATEKPPLRLDDDLTRKWMDMLRFRPEDHGLPPAAEDADYMYLNIGPHHPGTHGLLRVVLRLIGQEIQDAVCEIGFHHRAAEKMGERQTWHTYIPYTDRVDYLAGVLNNFPYVLAVEKLAGIEVPDRAKVIRIMTAELYRIISHLVFYGTFAQDVGMMSPVFYLFADRERALDIAEAITGGRMHPGWFRIGGVAQDLPEGWQTLMEDFLAYLPRQLREYDRMILANRIFRARTKGIGVISQAQAIDWGATGPVLRATGLAWDWRKRRPYGGYEQFEFDIPVGQRGDCYDRVAVHVEEMRQSLRIIRQCMDHMPPGPVKALHPLATPPPRQRMLEDIETLIHHFLQMSWGTVVPPGEAAGRVESAKGLTSYYLVSDGGTTSYRTRIRTPSFPHIQLVPQLVRGGSVSDLAAVLGSLDYVLSDVDR